MQPNEIIKKVTELCRKYSAEEAVLFGSRAKGTALERSDFDIAVSGVKDFYSMQEEAEDIKEYGKKIYEKTPFL